MAQHWDEGVELQLHGPGGYRTVRSTEDAAICLLERWPRARGRAYVAAQEACLKGLDGKLSAARVRDAFIRAAAEADIHIRAYVDPRKLAMQSPARGRNKISFSDGAAWRKANSRALAKLKDDVKREKE